MPDGTPPTSLSKDIADKAKKPTLDALDKVGGFFKDALDGKGGPILDDVSVNLNTVYDRAGAPLMDTAFGETLASLGGSGWLGKGVGALAGFVASNKGWMGFMHNSKTGRAIETGVVALGMLQQGTDVLTKMGVPGAQYISKLFDAVPTMALVGGMLAVGYTMFKPAVDSLGGKVIANFRDGSMLGLNEHPAS